MGMYIGLDVQQTVYVAQDTAGAVVGGGAMATAQERLAAMVRQVGRGGDVHCGLGHG